VIWADVVKTESRFYVFPNVVIASGGFKRVDPFTGIRHAHDLSIIRLSLVEIIQLDDSGLDRRKASGRRL
jgi:hypothetical protein